MRAKQSVEGRPYLPFLSMCASCFIWTAYGFILEDPTVALTNLVGFLLSCYYNWVYFNVSKHAEREQLSTHGGMVAAAAVGSVILIIVFSSNPNMHLGLLGSFSSIVMFGSPLMQIVTVLRTRSTRTMSFPLSAMSCLVTLSWTIYGHHLENNFIFYPNGLGFIFACAQLSLFVLYPSTAPVIVDLGV